MPKLPDDKVVTVPGKAEAQWTLRLYVAGESPNSLAAFANLKRICETHLHGKYELEIIDVHKNPRVARTDQVMAIPSLIRKLPPPMKKLVGNLANEERVLVGLELRPL